MNWPTVPLQEVAEIRGGGTPRRDNPLYWNGDIPWLTPSDLPRAGEGIVDVWATSDSISGEGLASSAANLLPPGTVVFSSRASIGKVGISAVPLTTNQGFANLIPRDGVDSRYLAWCLSFHADQIARLAGSTTFKEVSKTSLRRFRIPLPPVPEQRRIAELLDQADLLLRRRAEADAKTNRILPALFVKMFGDPTRNPMGWPEENLGSQAEILTGNTPSTKQPEYYGSALPWARPADLDKGPVVEETERALSSSGRSVARIVPRCSVLVVCIGATLGKVGIAGHEMAINQQINAILPSNRTAPEFLFVQCSLIADRFRSAATKSTLPILNKSRFAAQRIIVPPLVLQERFARQAQAVLELLSCGSAARRSLDSLFGALVGDAFLRGFRSTATGGEGVESA